MENAAGDICPVDQSSVDMLISSHTTLCRLEKEEEYELLSLWKQDGETKEWMHNHGQHFDARFIDGAVIVQMLSAQT